MSEIETLLSDDPGQLTPFEIEAGSSYKLGRPTSSPEPLLEALRNFVARSPHIHAIYFGLFQRNETEFSYGVFVDFCDSRDPLPTFQDVGVIIKEVGADRPVEIFSATKLHRDGAAVGSLITINTSRVF